MPLSQGSTTALSFVSNTLSNPPGDASAARNRQQPKLMFKLIDCDITLPPECLPDEASKETDNKHLFVDGLRNYTGYSHGRIAAAMPYVAGVLGLANAAVSIYSAYSQKYSILSMGFNIASCTFIHLMQYPSVNHKLIGHGPEHEFTPNQNLTSDNKHILESVADGDLNSNERHDLNAKNYPYSIQMVDESYTRFLGAPEQKGVARVV